MLTACLLSESTFIQRREELERNSQRLKKYMKIPDAQASLIASRMNQSHVAREISLRLKDWTLATSSQTLWIMGNPFTPECEASIAATHIVAIAQRANLPCLFFFCHLANFNGLRQDSERRHQDQLTTLLYALIRQLSMLTPENFRDSYDFTSALDSLQGSPESIPKALDIIRALLLHTPRLLLCVIDGLQILGHRDTNSYIDQLLDALRAQNDSRVFKLLLTTRGSFPSGKKLDVMERLDCMTLPRKRPGRAVPGGQSLQELSFS